jgi:orotidine-5'-phosphate decarboxylase
MERNIFSLLQPKWEARKFICVGLDTSHALIPEFIRKNKSVQDAIVFFNKKIIDATAQYVCAFKINSAFYEERGDRGARCIEETISYIMNHYPSVPVILDYKRGDIGNTNKGYAMSAFENLNADAVTVSPYLGSGAMEPFLNYKSKGIIILCRTSNPGAGEELQDLSLQTNEGSPRVFEHIAKNVRDLWNYNNNCMVVVGATALEQLASVRKIVGDMPILVPGVGKQGGSLKGVLINGLDSKKGGLIINSSRDVIYASDQQDFNKAAYEVVKKMNAEVESYFLSLL